MNPISFFRAAALFAVIRVFLGQNGRDWEAHLPVLPITMLLAGLMALRLGSCWREVVVAGLLVSAVGTLLLPGAHAVLSTLGATVFPLAGLFALPLFDPILRTSEPIVAVAQTRVVVVALVCVLVLLILARTQIAFFALLSIGFGAVLTASGRLRAGAWLGIVGLVSGVLCLLVRAIATLG